MKNIDLKLVPKRIVDKIVHLTFGCNSDNCINFPFLNADGYGSIQYVENGIKQHLLAHRLSYVVNNGGKNIDDRVVMHTCDNPKCVNPSHLIAGTHGDNVADKVSKGRQARGNSNGRYLNGYYSKYSKVEKPTPEWSTVHNRKLSKEKVLSVIEAIETRGTFTLREVALSLGVPYSTIRDINSKRAYSSIYKEFEMGKCNIF